MRKSRILAYIFISVFFATPFFGAKYTNLSRAPYKSLNLIYPNDTITALANDSDTITGDSILPADSLQNDTALQKKPPLDAIVDYKSADSIVMLKDNWGYLFGNAEVTYEDIKLTGEIISMNMDSSIVEATFGLDSIGEEFGHPIFSDKGTEYETRTMKYNFKTKKGYSQHLITEQGEGYVIAGQARKNEDNSFFMRDGQYTTCDQHDHPHFYLALTRAKVQPKRNVVTGPAYLVIEDLHIPFIGLPFGFFPFSEKYSSGVIMPSYGDDNDRGFNLHDGGYYFAINDHVDLKLLGTIFTKGSWGLSGQSTYKNRYKYSGNVSVGYQVSKYGDKDIPNDYSEARDMKIAVTHTQDPKFNMFRTISASVDYSTSTYDRNNLNTGFTPVSTQNTRSSSVNFTQRFPDSPWSLSGSMNINQRSSDSTVSITLPNLTVSMSRVFPFRRKEVIGSEKWYEKIQMSYTGDLRNSVTTTENEIFSTGLNEWNNAMLHTIPFSATFSFLDFLNITPSAQYRERWYTRKNTYTIINGSAVVDEEIDGFYRVFDFNASLGFQTKLFGFFSPLLFAKQTVIRHVFTPSISFNYTPDFGASNWGYWETLYGYDASTGLKREYHVSPFSSQMFGVPGRGAQGTIGFDFQNNIEMKTPWESDSTGYKKISLIDNLGLSFNYNTQAESFRWSDPNANIRLRLSRSLTVNLNATFDLYTYDFADPTLSDEQQTSLVRVDRMRISNGKGLARLMRTGYSISPTINQDTFNKLFGRNSKKEEEKKEEGNSESDNAPTKRRMEKSKDSGEYDEDGFLRNQIQWSLGFSYSMNYAYNTSKIDIVNREYKMQFTHALSFNGSLQPTKNWSFSFYGSYDLEQKKIPHMSCSISRNLHCWSISASFTPVGPFKNYFVSLRANSSLLQDLKHEFKGRTSSYDPVWD